MINIFNLFLVLFFFWLLLAYSGGVLSWSYVFFGLITAAIVSFVAWKIKIINKHSSFLFLNLGFYRHFFKIIASSFLASIAVAVDIASQGADIKPKFYSIPIKKLNNNEIVLLINTINLMAGLICVGFKDKNVIVYSVNDQCFKKLDVKKICDNLHKINDSRLV